MSGCSMSPRDRTMAALREVCWRHCVSLADLLGPSRLGPFNHPRRVAWRFLTRYRGFTSTQLGLLFKRDHTSILYGLRAKHVRRHWAARNFPQATRALLLPAFTDCGNKSSASGRAP